MAVRTNEVVTGSIRDYRFRIYRGDGSLERVVERSDTGFVPVALDEERRGIASIRSVGADGKLYTIASDPFPQVRRYRVVIEEPDGS